MKRAVSSIFILMLAFYCSGCSAVMAAWDDTADLNLLTKGTSRQVIEDEFGDPVATRKERGYTVNTYEFEIEPKGDPTPGFRVFMYSITSLFTFLILEPWNMYREANWEADYKIDVFYDANGRAVGFGKPTCFGDCGKKEWAYSTCSGGWCETSTYTWYPP